MNLTSWERILINISTVIVSLSGLVVAAMKYAMTADDPYAVVNHPLQPWFMDLHVLAGPAMIFAIGLIARSHIFPPAGRCRSRQGRGPARSTGRLAVATLLPLVATGYLIQVFTDATARAICVWIHLTTGAVYLAAFIAHLAVSRRMEATRRIAIAAELSGVSAAFRGSAGVGRGAAGPAARQAR